MIFTNINIYTILLVLILGLSGGYFFIRFFQKKIHRKQIGILCMIFLLLLVSILGPKGGMKSGISTTIGGNISFVVDVSKSMDALDFGAQDISRLQMTKNIISNYIQSEPNNRYALDVFSGDAVKILPFTNDISIYQTFLSGINQGNTGESGTDIIRAIYSSASHFTEDITGGLMVVFTDGGEEEIGNIGEIKDLLSEKNIGLIIVGIGSKDGNYIPAGTDFFGRTLYKTYQGEKVVTKLNSNTLKGLAKDLGQYREVVSTSDIDGLYDLVNSQSEKVIFESDTQQRTSLVGIFIFLGFFLWLLFLANMLASKYRKK